MKIHSDCGLSFKVWWTLTVAFELLSAILIGALGIWLYFLKVGSSFRLTYSPAASTNYLVKNANYEVLVTSYIVVILLSLCIARFLVAITLAIGVKKNSAEMAKFWIAFKVFAVMMSLFLVTASFNVSLITKVATLCALLTDLLSSYFIRILYPELDKMSKFIVMVDPEPTKL